MSEKKEGKSKAEELKEKLLINRKSGALKLSDKKIKQSDYFAEEYKVFLNESKTEREAVSTAVKLAKKAGFVEYNLNKKYKPGDKVYYVNRLKAFIAAVIGKDGTKNGIQLAVAHIDSPRLDLKPNPLYEANDLALFKTHYYGGIKKYQWTAIPLSLHGKIIKRDGKSIDVTIGENPGEPCFCVTDLLPHLSKEQMAKTMQKSIEGENLNILIGSLPFKDDKGSELVKLNIMKFLNEKYGIIESDFLSAELTMVPAFKAVDVGFDRSMVGGYGHDDKVCAYPTLRAIFDLKEIPEKTIISILTDKEEVGSDGNTGMHSSFFRFFLADLAQMDGMHYHHVLSKSKCLSADVNAAFDPTYASVYDPANSCYVNNGVVITKYTGSGGKAGTSDASAEFMAEVRSLLEKEKILWQTGELGKVDAGGGGTIAKFVANLNVDVVDLGVPVLSMHAPFEVISKIDLYMAYEAISAFFNQRNA
ncbi:MAG: putative M18 family aminopeptidase 1 [Eubacteriales bacterium SKADARSKE-1]|nr:putative M18 family aminopeptidase 1 [Eubacteriales bacterium SKADARSKE-1]